MSRLTEKEFARICNGIDEDREIIIKHNPMGTDEEILLWMLLGCLVSYLSLSDMETPCFTGRPDATTYRQAIVSILRDRRENDFEVEKYLEKLAV